MPDDNKQVIERLRKMVSGDYAGAQEGCRERDVWSEAADLIESLERKLKAAEDEAVSMAVRMQDVEINQKSLEQKLEHAEWFVDAARKNVDSYRAKFFPSVRDNDATNVDADELGWGLAPEYGELMEQKKKLEAVLEALTSEECIAVQMRAEATALSNERNAVEIARAGTKAALQYAQEQVRSDGE